VTGCGGFAGRHICEAFLSNGWKVSGIYRRRKPLLSASQLKNTNLVSADLRSPLPLTGLEQVDLVVHCAAQTQSGNTSIIENLDNNAAAVRNLADYCKTTGCRQFVYLSSLSIYGKIATSVVDESTPICNPGPYGLTKYIGELILQEYSADIDSLSIRLPGVIGQGAHSNWLATTVQAFARNEAVSMFNPGSLFNNAVHVHDLCDLVLNVATRKLLHCADVVTIAANGEMAISDIADLIHSRLNSTSEIGFCQSKATSFLVSSKRAIAKYGYAPMHIRKMLETYISETGYLPQAAV